MLVYYAHKQKNAKNQIKSDGFCAKNAGDFVLKNAPAK